MLVSEPLILPPGVLLLPVDDLPEALLKDIKADPGDFALVRPATRTLSKIIDSDLASLVQQFRSPLTIAQAVLRYSQDRSTPPQQTLESAFPLLQSLLSGQLLVPADSPAARERTPALHPGASIGKWQIISVVQSLEDSELCQVRDDSNNVFALKMLRPECGPEAVAALSREAGLLTPLDGCAVPRLFEAGEWEGRPYLVLSWLSGIDANAAAAECRNSPNSRAELLYLCRSIIDAYTELHSRGVIHGDVHPRNLIVSSDGTVHIIDFGLGRHIPSDDNVARGGVGFFFEPEFARALLNGRPVPASSEKSDQYAVAALLYLLLTSQHYTHFSLERDEQLRQIWKNDMDPFADSGTEPWPEAEALLAIALQKQADKRFPSMHDFARAWKLISAPPAV